jgi:hypothetical protein
MGRFKVGRPPITSPKHVHSCTTLFTGETGIYVRISEGKTNRIARSRWADSYRQTGKTFVKNVWEIFMMKRPPQCRVMALRQ